MERVRITDIMDKLLEWGIDTTLEYDENGDGWVLVFTENEQVQFIIHHGFEFYGEIYMDPSQVVIEVVNPTLHRIASRKLIIATARVEWSLKNLCVTLREPTYGLAA